MRAERDLVVTVAAARYDQSQMIENPFAEAVHIGEAMRGRQFDPRLPFLGAPVVEPFRRDPDLHWHPPVDSDLVRITTAQLAQPLQNTHVIRYRRAAHIEDAAEPRILDLHVAG